MHAYKVQQRAFAGEFHGSRYTNRRGKPARTICESFSAIGQELGECVVAKRPCAQVPNSNFHCFASPEAKRANFGLGTRLARSRCTALANRSKKPEFIRTPDARATPLAGSHSLARCPNQVLGHRDRRCAATGSRYRSKALHRPPVQPERVTRSPRARGSKEDTPPCSEESLPKAVRAHFRSHRHARCSARARNGRFTAQTPCMNVLGQETAASERFSEKCELCAKVP